MECTFQEREGGRLTLNLFSIFIFHTPCFHAALLSFKIWLSVNKYDLRIDKIQPQLKNCIGKDFKK